MIFMKDALMLDVNDAEGLKGRIEILKTENVKLCRENLDLQDQNRRISNRLDVLQAQNNELEKKMLFTKDTLMQFLGGSDAEGLEEILEVVKTENAKLRRKNLDLRDQNRRISNRLDVLQARNNELEKRWEQTAKEREKVAIENTKYDMEAMAKMARTLK